MYMRVYEMGGTQRSLIDNFTQILTTSTKTNKMVCKKCLNQILSFKLGYVQ